MRLLVGLPEDAVAAARDRATAASQPGALWPLKERNKRKWVSVSPDMIDAISSPFVAGLSVPRRRREAKCAPLVWSHADYYFNPHQLLSIDMSGLAEVPAQVSQ